MFIEGIHKIFIFTIRLLFNLSAPIIGPKKYTTRTKDMIIEGDFKLRIYTSLLDKEEKVIVYFHGGGWIIGSIKAYDRILRLICAKTGFTVIGVEYRKGPEHRYPQALEDARTAYRWVIDNIVQDKSKTKVVLIGDSAGGNLIIELLAQIDNSDCKSLDQVILVYPVINLSSKLVDLTNKIKPRWLNTLSYVIFKYCLKLYTANSDGIEEVDYDKFAVSNSNNKQYLRIKVITAHWDILTTSIEQWKEKLASYEYDVTSIKYYYTYHGFLNFSSLSKQAREALKYIVSSVNEC